MAKCDLCGGDCRPLELEQLLDSYQTAGVVDVCPTCRKWANELKNAIIAELAPRMREAIAAKKAQPPVPDPPWWKRFVS